MKIFTVKLGQPTQGSAPCSDHHSAGQSNFTAVSFKISHLSPFPGVFLFFNYIHFEITSDPWNLIGSHWCDLFTIRIIFCSKSHLFPCQWESQSLVQGNHAIWKKMKKNNLRNFATFYNPAHYWINKTFVKTKNSVIWATEFFNFKMDVMKW